MEKFIISNPSKLGMQIRELRSRKGLNLKEFAASVGITHSYLSQIERGIKKAPSLLLLHKVASELGLSLSDLMDLGGQKYELENSEIDQSKKYDNEECDVDDDTAVELDIFEITDYLRMKGLTCDKKVLKQEESKQIINFARFLISQRN